MPQPELTLDEEFSLIAAAQRGEVEPFNTLIRHYQGVAYNVAYRILGDPDSAADVTQEAFIAAFRRIRDFRTTHFRGWLLRIVTNACYDELRRRKRRPQVSVEELAAERPDGDAESLPALIANPDDEPERAAQRAALNAAIQACLDALPLSFRTVAIMADVQELSYDEVALALNLSVGTVKSRLSRARDRLRDCLRTARELLAD